MFTADTLNTRTTHQELSPFQLALHRSPRTPAVPRDLKESSLAKEAPSIPATEEVVSLNDAKINTDTHSIKIEDSDFETCHPTLMEFTEPASIQEEVKNMNENDVTNSNLPNNSFVVTHEEAMKQEVDNLSFNCDTFAMSLR